MTFFEGVIELARQFLVFYLPVFFTFRFLMANDTTKVRTILKFWCMLSLYYIVQHIIELVVKGYLATLLDLAALAALNYDHFYYAEQLYDKFVAPLYRDNHTLIQKYTEQIEKLFDKNSEALKSKVASSAGEKIKGFMGEIMVGVLNPSSQKTKAEKEVREEKDSDEDREDDE